MAQRKHCVLFPPDNGTYLWSQILIYPVHKGQTWIRCRKIVKKNKSCFKDISFLNPAYRRFWISWYVQIVEPIPRQTDKDRKGEQKWFTCHVSHATCQVSKSSSRLWFYDHPWATFIKKFLVIGCMNFYKIGVNELTFLHKKNGVIIMRSQKCW